MTGFDAVFLSYDEPMANSLHSASSALSAAP